MGKYVSGLSHAVYEQFLSYDWPGNIRELRNSIECGFNMTVTPVLELGDVYPGQEGIGGTGYSNIGRPEEEADPKTLTLAELLERKERVLIRKACAEAKNLSEAAHMLGISRQGLAKKLQG